MFDFTKWGTTQNYILLYTIISLFSCYQQHVWNISVFNFWNKVNSTPQGYLCIVFYHVPHIQMLLIFKLNSLHFVLLLSHPFIVRCILLDILWTAENLDPKCISFTKPSLWIVLTWLFGCHKFCGYGLFLFQFEMICLV